MGHEITNIFDFLFAVIGKIIGWSLFIAFLSVIPLCAYNIWTGKPVLEHDYEKKEKPPRKPTNKERKRIEKAIDDAYKRMR